MSGPEVVPGQPARDPDGDGLYEDVNGDGDVTMGDATVLFNAIFENRAAVMNNVEKFDFNGDGELTPADATVLSDRIANGTALEPDTTENEAFDSEDSGSTSTSPTGLDALSVALSSPTYRVGQPHRVTATISNKSDRPVTAEFFANIILDDVAAPIQNKTLTIKARRQRSVEFRSDGSVQFTGTYPIELLGSTEDVVSKKLAETTATIKPPKEDTSGTDTSDESTSTSSEETTESTSDGSGGPGVIDSTTEPDSGTEESGPDTTSTTTTTTPTDTQEPVTDGGGIDGEPGGIAHNRRLLLAAGLVAVAGIALGGRGGES